MSKMPKIAKTVESTKKTPLGTSSEARTPQISLENDNGNFFICNTAEAYDQKLYDKKSRLSPAVLLLDLWPVF